jgi:hypothetical protein
MDQGYMGGIWLATVDMEGDGNTEILTGTSNATAEVRAVDKSGTAGQMDFMPFESNSSWIDPETDEES